MVDQRIPNGRKRLGALGALAALILLWPGGGSSASAATLPSGFQDQAVISNLNLPTSVRFSPDGRVFVAEKSGLIKVFSSLSDTTPATFADLRNQVYDFHDRGLLGLELHPSFPQQPFVYALYSHDAPIGGTAPDFNDDCPSPPGANTDGCVGSARLSKLTASGDFMTGSEQVLIEDWCIQFITHSIGDLVFGPDGALYISGGDGAGYEFTDYGQRGIPRNPCGDPPSGVGGTLSPPTAEGGSLRSQDVRTTSDPTSLDGAILRVNPDTGAAMAGNPLSGSGDANARRIVAHGFRNPFRFTFRPGTNEIWVGDVGNGAWEEIDRIQDPIGAPAENLGWPCYEGSGRQGGFDGANLNLCESLYTQGGVTAPYFQYSHSSTVVGGESCSFSGGSSISGMAFYGGGAYPDAYDGALFFSDYSRNCIWAMPTNGGQLPNTGSVLTFSTGAPAPVQLEIGPGGDLFYVNIFGEIRRIRYVAGNQPPTAIADASPTSGPTPLTVNFDATDSTDPENDPLSYAWDLDADGAFDDSTSPTPSRTYTNPDTYNVRLRVSDPGGGTSTDSVTVTAGGSPPSATIGSPAPSLTWKVDDRIDFSGSATDPQDGTLAASRFIWALDLHHCSIGCHVHPIRDFQGVRSGFFFTPDHDFPAYLTLRLTVTDSSGLTDTEEVRLDPRTAQLTLNASPPGLQLGFGSSAVATPSTQTVIVGSTHSLSAPSPQPLGGAGYAFSGWSDGGAQAHDVTVNESRMLTAQYVPNGESLLSSGAFPPDTVIRHGPKGKTKNRTPTFRFRSRPRGSASGFSCRLDDGPWGACASPLTLPPLTLGKHVFRVRSVGPRGVADRTAARRRFKVVAGDPLLRQQAARPSEQAAERAEQRTGVLEKWRRIANQLNQFVHWRTFCQLPQAVGEKRI